MNKFKAVAFFYTGTIEIQENFGSNIKFLRNAPLYNLSIYKNGKLFLGQRGLFGDYEDAYNTAEKIVNENNGILESFRKVK